MTIMIEECHKRIFDHLKDAFGVFCIMFDKFQEDFTQTEDYW